jgi:threonyl-tRNA synthetase
MVKKEVFERSGHFGHYKENMFYFSLPGEPKEIYVLKPMNCPESTYIYNSRARSWRDLPLRLSEITDRLHRNELSGVLGGLFRVRQMTQDDAHIYCRANQIESEVLKLIDLVREVYKNFALPLSFNLATRPEKAMGRPLLWNKAEAALAHALKSAAVKYEVKQKDGAFYGPKIDVNAKDSLGREWTVATIQLDFQLPEKFGLSYVDERGRKERPVIIHRAILGTFERFIGIILEHFEGKLPLWLSPVQADVINVGAGQRKYAEALHKKLKDGGIRAELSDENLTVGKRIREAEIRKIPYILVVGEKEEKNGTVNVRHYRRGQEGEIAAGKLIEKVEKEIAEKVI